MARKTGPRPATTKPKSPPKKAKPKVKAKAKAKPKAKAKVKAKKAVILAVDNGKTYDFAFKLGRRQLVRVVGKHLAPGATVRLSSHKAPWKKFRHKAKVVLPAPHLGKGYQMILLRDTPEPREAVESHAAARRRSAVKPPRESSGGGDDSGDLIVTVTNTGTPATIKTNEVLYVLE